MNKNRRKERKSQKKNVDKNGEKVGEKDSNKKQTNVSARIGWTRQSKKIYSTVQYVQCKK